MSYSDDSGYDLDSPKHPSFQERYAGAADDRRKRDRENPPIVESATARGPLVFCTCQLISHDARECPIHGKQLRGEA